MKKQSSAFRQHLEACRARAAGLAHSSLKTRMGETIIVKRYYCLLWCFVLILGAGCSSGPPPIPVKGKLLLKDVPFKVDQKVGVTVVFIPVQAGDFDTYPANYEREDGSFTIPGKDGRGIPAGKYKVSISQMSMQKTPEMQKLNDMLSPQKTTIIREVTKDSPEITIDLSKPGG
jgi:hypothetical protein